MITELMESNPVLSIIIIGVIVTFISTLLTKWLTNQEHLKSLKKRQKEIQQEIKKSKDDFKLIQELQSEMLKITGTMMKSSFRPILITFVPFVILFIWMRGIYEPILGRWTWIFWYLGASIVSSMILRKVFDVA